MIRLIANRYIKQETDITMLLFAFRLAYVFIASAFLHNKELKHHLYSGTVLFIMTYLPIELFYYLIILCINFLIMIGIANYRLKTTVLLIMNLSIIVVGSRCGKRLGVDVGNFSSISSEVMLLVPKMYFVCNKQKALSQSAFGYIFFVPSLALGPVVPFSELGKRIQRRFGTTILKTLQCAFFAFVLLYGKKVVSRDVLINDKDISVFCRTIYLYLFTLHYRMQYYFVWSFSSLCFYVCGLNVSNAMFFNVELATSLEEVATFWNYWISWFLKKSIYIPLRKYSRVGAMLATSVASALWHGGRGCDFLFLVSYNISIPILKKNSVLMKRHLNYYVYVFFVTLQTAFFVSYIPVPFYFNSAKTGLLVWKNIYFVGHVALFMSLLIHLALALQMRVKGNFRNII
eukprot:jgi/Antlo1/1501/2047